ncbi:hypothetical protein AXE65_06570 [Ventosimonas gracilis]|uniref:Uncharacterized protein n=1 Tax=Ventosimonas gracilis TaxID=1680762 RepID=A0A139SJS8_9GAMM|nr:hypothetical protein AXE65_06570 [Ventosimonas gracilis]
MLKVIVLSAMKSANPAGLASSPSAARAVQKNIGGRTICRQQTASIELRTMVFSCPMAFSKNRLGLRLKARRFLPKRLF